MRNQPTAPQPASVPVRDAFSSDAHPGEKASHVTYSSEPAGDAHQKRDEGLPLMDPAVLLDLGEKLNSPEIACGFARDFAAMWDLRRRRLAASLDRRDYSAALDAVISLKVSSAMVGGLRLARLAEEVEVAVRRGDLTAGLALMGTVTDYGHETVNELRLRYVPEATST